eukprot:GHVS01107633.1.p1 GENE.GHVS01107633.1~~GHVS01107633.1.p1  ORF type:complete len:212 (-),score=22.85 GHVS01107633.1:176-811(-)
MVQWCPNQDVLESADDLKAWMGVTARFPYPPGPEMENWFDAVARHIKHHQLGVEVFQFVAEARMALPLARRFARIQAKLEHELPFPRRHEDPSRAQDWLQDSLARYLRVCLDALPLQVQKHLELQNRLMGPPRSLERLFESAEAAFDTLPESQARCYPGHAPTPPSHRQQSTVEAYPVEDRPMEGDGLSRGGSPPSADVKSVVTLDTNRSS